MKEFFCIGHRSILVQDKEGNGGGRAASEKEMLVSGTTFCLPKHQTYCHFLRSQCVKQSQAQVLLPETHKR